MSDFGFAADKVDQRPHVTLARVKRRPPHELAELFDHYAQTEFARFSVTEIKLLKSQLSPHGPRYFPLTTAALC